MAPSVFKPTWPLKKFSLRETPSLIKRDIKCLFSRKARAEKRAEEQRQRSRWETKSFDGAEQCNNTEADPAQEQPKQTSVCTPTTSATSIEAIEPRPVSQDTATTITAFNSNSSSITPHSTPATKCESIKQTNLPTTCEAAMAYFEDWYKLDHANINIPASERATFRGVVIVLTIALLKCFKQPKYSAPIELQSKETHGPYSPYVLEQILSSLTKDRQDAQRVAEHLLSISVCDCVFGIQPSEFLRRIGHAKTRITNYESQSLHWEFRRLLSSDCRLC